jgi:hypothetical protein
MFATQTRLLPFFVGVANSNRPEGAQTSLRLVLNPTVNKDENILEAIENS